MSDFYCEEVLTGKTKVDKVSETENVLAFHHTKPSYKIHVVVISKKHVASFLALEDDNLLSEMFKVIKQVAYDITNRYGSCRIVTNLGGYQESKHLHWHIYCE
ncbi:HIT domain-containing protein [Candidatus Gottesmanbacteria bacterium]|nr:HIT domain-containing protein [Candidatus Gottesmanbacteria bacterium]